MFSNPVDLFFLIFPNSLQTKSILIVENLKLVLTWIGEDCDGKNKDDKHTLISATADRKYFPNLCDISFLLYRISPFVSIQLTFMGYLLNDSADLRVFQSFPESDLFSSTWNNNYA